MQSGHRRLSPEEQRARDEKIVKLHLDHVPRSLIAERFGMAPQGVNDALRRMGVAAVQKPKRRA